MSTNVSKSPAVDLSSSDAALGVLRFTGADAARFLNGQLSANVESLAAGQSHLAGFHNPQGRVIALLALLRSGPAEFFAVLPRALATPVAERLRKYVLRAKVLIEDASDAYTVLGATHDIDSGCASMTHGSRRRLLAPAERLGEFTLDTNTAAWTLDDIREGLPQVYPATSEAFVAQMLNLDLLGAVSFDKGCYTGQEVIARTHYRGRVKRRMQRWRTLTPGAPLAVGTQLHAADGRALTLLCAAPDGNGLQELLAVGTFGAESAPGEPPAEAVNGQVVEGPLPLPYTLPE